MFGLPHAALTSLFGGLLRFRRADGGLDVPLLLGRRQHRLHPQRLDPQLPAPSLGVIEVLVFLVLDLLVGILQRLACLAL